MRITSAISFTALLAVLSASAFADNTTAITVEDPGRVINKQENTVLMQVTPQAGALLETLSSQLNVTNEQAVGGAGALLALAKNQLTGNEARQLDQSVPGLEKLTDSKLLDQLGSLKAPINKGTTDNARGLSDPLTAQAEAGTQRLGSLQGQIHSKNDVNKTFTALGMDHTMVDKFIPVMQDYLGKQGVDAALMKRLSSIWGV